MAPIPEQNNEGNNNSLLVDVDPPKPDVPYWTKANIALTSVFALLALSIVTVLLAFYFRRRSEKKKLQQMHHPKSDKAGLLQHVDKSSMFSRHRHSSVTLYVDSEADSQQNKTSRESMALTPVHETPSQEARDLLTRLDTTTRSNGSGISTVSRLSTNTASTMILSPVSPCGDDGDLSIRPSGRPRSVSTISQRGRYYETTPTNIDMPPVPEIVRTPSE